MTVRLPFGISRIFSMRAAVPTRYISSGDGFSTSLSRCNTAPSSSFSSLTALTKAMLFSRPTVIGVIAPGKSTELRSVRMGNTSGMATSSIDSSSPLVTIGIIWCLWSAISGIVHSSCSVLLFLLFLSILPSINIIFYKYSEFLRESVTYLSNIVQFANRYPVLPNCTRQTVPCCAVMADLSFPTLGFVRPTERGASTTNL